MKSIIKKLVVKKESAPAPHLKLIQELQGMDDLSALEATTKFLTILNDTTLEAHALQFDPLLQLDELNYQRFKKIIHQYAKFDKLRPELEARIVESCYYYQRQIFLNYRMHADVHDKLGTFFKHKEFLPLIVSRGMHAAFLMMKLRHFQHQRVPDGAWNQLYSLYRIAEKAGVTDVRFPLYRNEEAQTAGIMFAQTCMLDTINHSNLSRLQVEVAAELLRRLLNGIQVSAEYDEKQHFYFADLSKDKGAKRIRMFTPTPDCRYWPTDQLSLRIELLHNSKNRHDLLQKIGIGEIAAYPGIDTLLAHLQGDWTRTEYKRQRRKEERQSAEQTVSAILGAEPVFLHAKNVASRHAFSNAKSTNTKSFEERLSSHSITKGSSATVNMPSVKMNTGPRWIISDESSGGYGVVIAKEEKQQLAPGMLIGLEIESKEPIFAIGILKNINELPNGQRHVGIEVLSRKPLWVQLIPVDTNAATTLSPLGPATMDGSIGFSGLYLAPEQGVTTAGSLLMPRLKFQQNMTYRLSTTEKKIFQQLPAPIDAKRDWVRVPFEGEL